MSNDTQPMTKVVINAQYGGFSLSTEAKREYLRRAGLTWTETETEWSRLTGPLFEVAGHPGWYDRDLNRTDPILIAVVEEMGEAANGTHAALEVRTLPKGTKYRIGEYDGYEAIETRDGIEWATA